MTGFLWGSAVSANAVEGDNFNSDWWRWEQRPGRVKEGASSKLGAGHYARYRDDFRLMRKLGQNALLLNLEWSRIEPEPGRFDDEAIAHYDGVFDALAGEGIEPVCALHHATSPSWFGMAGGWAGRDAVTLFERYAQRVAERYASKCRWWVPVLEPMHLVEMAYVEGLWPPGRAGAWDGWRAFRNLAQSHAAAYRVLHGARSDAMVGASTRARVFRPLNEHSAWDYRAALRETARCNRWFFDAVTRGEWPRLPGRPAGDVSNTADFLAFSYYGEEAVRFNVLRPRRLFSQAADEHGARPYPGGLRDVIDAYAAYKLPLLVAGNGLATEDDGERCAYMLDHVSALLDCREKGADLRGYFWYSLLDGFEWTEGYGRRYGLIHVDPSSLARTPNGSAYLYRDICESGRVRRGAVDQFCPGWNRGEARK